MGGAGSKQRRRKEKVDKDDSHRGVLDKFDAHGKRILSPLERTERRYMRSYGHAEEAAADFADIDQTVDRYDYLIIFPNPAEDKKGRYRDVEEARSAGNGGARTHAGDADAGEAGTFITLGEVAEIWYSAVPGDEVAKHEAQDKLRREFDARFRTPAEFSNLEESREMTMSRDEWLRLAREVIINTLYAKSGLQLKLTVSRDGSKVLCRVRAPVALLEQQAAREGYRLQFRGEVDPGYDFWTEEEIAEEQRLYSKDEANELLEKLYQAEKISPNDIAVFDEEPTDKHFSRRLHTLERIADRVPVTNRYPAYSEFTLDGKDRHLYQTYPSIRGRTLFRAKDRLALTKSIIDAYFDMGVLAAKDVIDSMTALHDANRGDRITTEVLQKRWVLWWHEDPDRIGAPMVTMDAMDEWQRVSWYMRPFSQPLDDVRCYFGEKLAMYFAWLGFYGWSLAFPAILCMAAEIYMWSHSISFGSQLDLVQIGVAAMIVVWGAVYQEFWEREEKAVAVKWGTHGFEESEKDRPQFEGDRNAPGGGRRRSAVTNTYETYFPEGKRRTRQALGLAVVVFFIACLLALVQFTEWLEHYLQDTRGYSWGGTAGSIISSIQIQVLSYFYGSVVTTLNDYENYRTETAYEHNLIFKTFLFQMFNNYSALFYQAFISGSVYGCSPSCVSEVRGLLVSIFVVRFAMAGVELVRPWAQSFFTARAATKRKAQQEEEASLLGNTTASQEEEPFEAEVHLPAYDGTFDDFAAIVLQYGYVTMFVSALPLIVPLAMLEVLLQIRVDSYKLVSLMRRPDPELAEEVGMWSTLMHAMSFLSIFTNAAIICFSGGALDGTSVATKFLIWLVAEHVMLGVKVCIHLSIDDVPGWLATIEARQRFIVQKHKHGFVRDDGSGDDGSMRKQQAGHLDIVGLQFQARKKRRQSSAATEQLSRLAAERRDVTRLLKTAKEQLQTAYQNEMFNEATGIGETKHGLPLGCLNVKLIRLEGLESEPAQTSVVLSLSAIKQGDSAAPGPPPQASRPAERGRASLQAEGGGGKVMEFNQVFVMAPVRTQDAELVFDVMVKAAGAPPRRAGSCRVALRELADQTEHDYPLTLQQKVAGKWEPAGGARLFVKVKFMYSKIVPLRNKIYALQDRKRTIEREITMVEMGGDDGDTAAT